MKIILGSSSPRRKEILKNIFSDLDIIFPSAEEKQSYDESPNQFCERIAVEKAKSILQYISDSSTSLIISCDTIVTIDNLIIGKPADFTDAVKKIQLLNGKTHEVISSISLLYINNKIKKQITRSEISRVAFKAISDTEIIEYLKAIDYKDKAGAYSIQDHGYILIDFVEGSLTNVVGFPLRLFFRMLSEIDLFDILNY